MDLQEAVNNLSRLDSSSAVANLMKTEGIKGRPYSFYECPIAKYLSKVTGEIVKVGANAAWTERIVGTYHLGKSVRLFIQQFDWGDWPELKETRE